MTLTTMRAEATVRAPERESNQTDPASMIASAIRAIARIAEAWGFTGEQMAALLGTSKSTYYRMLRAAADARNEEAARALRLAAEGPTRERLSLILGIYRGLHLYFSMNEAAADEWVNRPNTSPTFGGQSAKEMMLSGSVSDLFRVRQYVDALLV